MVGRHVRVLHLIQIDGGGTVRDAVPVGFKADQGAAGSCGDQDIGEVIHPADGTDIENLSRDVDFEIVDLVPTGFIPELEDIRTAAAPDFIIAPAAFDQVVAGMRIDVSVVRDFGTDGGLI